MSEPSHSRGIIPWFAANPVAANLLMLLVIALGVVATGSIRKEAFPSIAPDSISISVVYNSGSAKQSEEGIAMKIEDSLQGVTGIKEITSTSTANSATITVEKQSDYDLDILLRDVKAKVDGVSNLPAEAYNPVVSKAERAEHALWLQLYGDTDRHTLQALADELKNDLLGSPNISRVEISGWLDPMMVVEIDETKLEAYGLSLSDVENVVNNWSNEAITAVLRNKHFYLQLNASQQAYMKKDFMALPLLTDADGTQLTIGDVATVTDTFRDDTSSLSHFQDKNSIALEVITTGLDDITNSVNAAKDVVKEWHKDGKLPANVQLTSWYDRSTSITSRLNLMVKNALSGIIFVFVLLALFLNLRVAFWVAMGLPFIFFGSLFFMGDNFVGLSLNSMTTFGFIMALGIVVDDAVVIGESIYTVRSQEGDTLANTIKGTMRVAVPTMFGVFTTVAAFFSLTQISGGLGEIYSQFATVVTLCLVLSLVESKMILPAHLSHLKTHKKPGGNWPLRQWQKLQHLADWGLSTFVSRIYRPLIHWALEYRYAVCLLFIALFILVVAMPLTGALRLSFFPRITGDTVRASLTMQNDVSYGQTHHALALLEQTAEQVDRELLNDKQAPSGIKYMQVISESDQAGNIRLQLREDAPYNINVFANKWRELTGMPEGAKTLNIRSFFNMVDGLRIELRANDDEILRAAGGDLKTILQKTAGVSGIDDNLEPGQPRLNIRLNAQGKAMGFTMNMLARQVLQSFHGQVVQRYQRNSDEIEVKVRYPEAERQNPADVLKSRVRNDEGVVVPLSTIANVEYTYTRDSITRIDNKRAVYISADVDKKQISSTELVAKLQQDVVPRLQRQYPTLGIHFAGEAEEQRETETSMGEMFALSMLVIYILLAVPLRSYIQPILIMTAIPFGIVGAIIGHWWNDLSLGILSLNGIIALSGVVVNDSLLLVSTYNELKEEHVTTKDAIAEACCSRLRAVFLTSITTYAGLVPLLSETSLQAQFLVPAAVSLAYGILFATVITLLLIPSQLMILEDIQRGLRRWRYQRYHNRKQREQTA